jgi:hypothetical protein
MRSDIRLYCEDEDGGPSARILLSALAALAPEMRIARSIEPLPTGSKEDVKVRVRHARRDRTRAFGVRDRDFLERPLIDELRSQALHTDWKRAEAWPLSRYSIESYLLDPLFLAEALPHRDEAAWRAVLDEMAEARRWLDLTRAALVDVKWRLSKIKWSSAELHVASRDEALAEICSRLGENRASADEAMQEQKAMAKFEALERDFAADGPLFLRVDGKKLLGALDDRLVHEGTRRARGLLGALLTHAERRACPRALLEDLKPLLVGVEAAHRSWV